jgi:hypothetical protein
MKKLVQIIIILFIFNGISGQNSNYIDPTGTYKLQSSAEKVGEDIYGSFGKIKVKILNNQQIIISFTINTGAPDYNEGSIYDTLDYIENRVTYKIINDNQNCEITFDFDTEGILVETQNGNFMDCEFGWNVMADGYFIKTSSEEPEIKASYE